MKTNIHWQTNKHQQFYLFVISADGRNLTIWYLMARDMIFSSLWATRYLVKMKLKVQRRTKSIWNINRTTLCTADTSCTGHLYAYRNSRACRQSSDDKYKRSRPLERLSYKIYRNWLASSCFIYSPGSARQYILQYRISR